MIFTHELEIKLQEQFISIWTTDSKITWSDCLALVKVKHPLSTWSWYIISQDPEDDNYLWVITDGYEVESGSFLKCDFDDLLIDGLPFQIDSNFKPINAGELFSNLLNARKNG